MMNLFQEIGQGESKTLEFKESFPKNIAIAKTVIAFANGAGGKLIIGVNDQGRIVGIDEDSLFETQDRIASIIYDVCYPNIIPEIYTANIGGKLVLVTEVFPGNLKPYYIKQKGKNDGTYIRVGATNRKAAYENIVYIERQRRNICFDEDVHYDYDVNTLDLSPLEKEFKNINKSLTFEKMQNLKLLRTEYGKRYLSNGLLILLGLFEHVRIKCSRFKGETMDIFIDKKEFDGNLFQQLRETEFFIQNHIHLKGEIKGLQRTDIYEIPMTAIREALLNAIVHRDYTNQGRDIKVSIFDHLIHIVSPGGFPSTLTEFDILNGRSEIRNKVIARVFKSLNYIEQWGTGIQRIQTSCISQGLKKPTIREKGDFVEVTLFRQHNNNVGKVSERYRNDNVSNLNMGYNYKIKELAGHYGSIGKVSESEMVIIDWLKVNKSIVSKKVGRLLNLKEARARQILKQMIEKQLIVRQGNGKNTAYTLTT